LIAKSKCDSHYSRYESDESKRKGDRREKTYQNVLMKRWAIGYGLGEVTSAQVIMKSGSMSELRLLTAIRVLKLLIGHNYCKGPLEC
jgi:hypothetical protein